MSDPRGVKTYFSDLFLAEMYSEHPETEKKFLLVDGVWPVLPGT